MWLLFWEKWRKCRVEVNNRIDRSQLHKKVVFKKIVSVLCDGFLFCIFELYCSNGQTVRFLSECIYKNNLNIQFVETRKDLSKKYVNQEYSNRLHPFIVLHWEEITSKTLSSVQAVYPRRVCYYFSQKPWFRFCVSCGCLHTFPWIRTLFPNDTIIDTIIKVIQK